MRGTHPLNDRQLENHPTLAESSLLLFDVLFFLGSCIRTSVRVRVAGCALLARIAVEQSERGHPRERDDNLVVRFVE